MQNQNYSSKQAINPSEKEEKVESEKEMKTTAPKSNSIKKYFKKDHNCTQDNCTRKYSSKIALNAHIKKKHLIEKDSE